MSGAAKVDSGREQPLLSGGRRAEWRLPLLLGVALAVITLAPYLYAYASQPPGRVFMGFFFLGDDANTYLAKMREGLEGGWIWTNRYSSEPSPGAYFFVFWLALGHLAGLLHLPLLVVFHLARAIGSVALLSAGWLFIRHFVEDPRARRFGIWFYALALGCGYVIQALGQPQLFGQQTDTLDWRMPELSAFYSVLALPHFAWAAAFQAAAVVFTFQAAERASLRLGLLAGAAWLGLDSIHAQMPILIGAAIGFALLLRPVGRRGFAAAGLALLIAAPYVIYSYYESNHSPDVLRWASQWRNNLPPDLVSLTLGLLPQLALGALGLPGAIRRRSRGDIFLLAWLVLVGLILWTPNPAGNLRRRFFDGISLPLAVLAARGVYEQIMPRLGSPRSHRLVPFGIVAFSAIGSLFLLLAPFAVARSPVYSVSGDEYRALNWLNTQPGGVVLSSERIGLYIPAYSSDTAYVGQYSETWHWREKAREARGVLTGATGALDFATAHGIRYVLWSPDYGSQPPPELAGSTPIFDRPAAKVYRLG